MNDTPLDNLSFEESLAELEGVIRDLEDGQTGLEEALARYERGVGLLKRCYAQLGQAEQRILQLTGTDAENQPVLQAFEHSATDVQALKKKNRGKGRSPEPGDSMY